MKVLITGTSQGIGKAIAELFLQKGHDVIGIDRQPSSVKNANYSHYCLDIRDYGNLPAISGINILINNAYQRIRHFLSVESCEEPQMELLSLLEESFTTAQAIEIGKQLHVTERTVMNYLKGLEKNRLIHKVKQGNYEKRTLEQRNCNK